MVRMTLVITGLVGVNPSLVSSYPCFTQGQLLQKCFFFQNRFCHNSTSLPPIKIHFNKNTSHPDSSQHLSPRPEQTRLSKNHSFFYTRFFFVTCIFHKVNSTLQKHCTLNIHTNNVSRLFHTGLTHFKFSIYPRPVLIKLSHQKLHHDFHPSNLQNTFYQFFIRFSADQQCFIFDSNTLNSVRKHTISPLYP